jgi:hypothetical protein
MLQVVLLMLSPAGRVGEEEQAVMGEPVKLGVPVDDAVLRKKL